MRRWCAWPRGNEALLHPFVDSKGNFGKVYSRDMAYAASRYTEAKLGAHLSGAVPRHRQGHGGLCGQLRRNKLKEPTLLPTTFPTMFWLTANTGIAVGMASNRSAALICEEVCNTTIDLDQRSQSCDLPGAADRAGFSRRAARFSTTPQEMARNLPHRPRLLQDAGALAL